MSTKETTQTTEPNQDTNSGDKDQKIKVAFNGLGHKLYFAFKKSIKMRKVMDMFANSADVPRESIIFVLDGVHLRPDNTAESIGLLDSDVIEVFKQTDGGSAY